MKARIFVPVRTAMQQSGQSSQNTWILEFTPLSAPFIEPLMGWTGSADTTRQLRLSFATQEAAIEYAKRNGLEFEVRTPEARTIKPKSYAANFASNRVLDTFGANHEGNN